LNTYMISLLVRPPSPLRGGSFSNMNESLVTTEQTPLQGAWGVKLPYWTISTLTAPVLRPFDPALTVNDPAAPLSAATITRHIPL
jgi:hypothetical protein